THHRHAAAHRRAPRRAARPGERALGRGAGAGAAGRDGSHDAAASGAGRAAEEAMRALLALCLLAGAAHAVPPVTRLARVAPDGSGWARELRLFAQQIEQNTQGRVRVKWYMNAVAGDELEMTDRLKRGLLDGVGSGGMVCE